MLTQRVLTSTGRCSQLFVPPCRSFSKHRIHRYSGGHIADAPAAVTAGALPEDSATGPSVLGLVDILSTGARLTTAAQSAWAQVLRPGDTAVDATCGNGHDTLFLAQAVGPNGHVYGFDIQAIALAATRERLQARLGPDGVLPRLTLTQTCHSHMRSVCGAGAARVVVFNLGYLPGAGDKRVATGAETTVAALEAALEVVMPGGLVSVLAYVGHPGGQEEYEAVCGLMARLQPSHWVTAETRLLNRPTAPILLLVWRQQQGSGTAQPPQPPSPPSIPVPTPVPPAGRDATAPTAPDGLASGPHPPS